MTEPRPTRSPRNRTKSSRTGLAAAATWAHGWTRSADLPGARALADGIRRRAAPSGTSLLLGLVVVAIAAAGIVRVRASARVLGLGAEITELTDEQSRLQERKRRLLAERAYLRHPDQIGDAARDRFGMVAVVPDLVQEIRLVEPAPD